MEEMAAENMLKSKMNSDELNVENIKNVRKIENDLIDALSKKAGNKEFGEMENEMGKAASGIHTVTEELEYEIEHDEMLKEGKRKLDNSVKDVNCGFSGVISDSTTSNEVQDRASKNLEDIKYKINRFAENIGEIVSEKANELEKLEKTERRTDSILAVINNEDELAENVGKIASGISTGFEELCKVTVTSGLGEAVDEDVDGIVSEKVNAFEKFSSDVNEKASENLEEKEEKMDEFTKETFGEFRKLNEESDNNMKDVEQTNEKLDFNEGIDGKTNEINMMTNSEKKYITCGLDDGERRIIEMSDICVMKNEKDIRQDEFSGKNPVGATNGLLNAATIDNLQSNTFDEDTEEMKGVTAKRALKSEYDKEIQAIKKIVSAGENFPEQVGTLTESGVYHDDYEPEEPESIVTVKLQDFMNDGVDEMDKLLEEAFNIDGKLKERGIIDDRTHQEDDTHQKEAKKMGVATDTISEVFQKVNINQHCIACEEMQGQELHNMMIDLNDSSTAIGDSKSEIQFIGDKEQELTNISPQLSPISEQTKKLILSSIDDPGLRVLQHPNTTESLNIASEKAEKKESEFKHSSEAVLESSFVSKKSFIVDEEKVRYEIKPIPVPLHSEHITDQDAININKTLNAVPEFSNNTVPSPFQSPTSEGILKFSTTPVTLENALQSTVPVKSNDLDKIITETKIKSMQEKIEPELQSAKTSFAEKSINLGGPPNHMLPLSPENTVSLRQPVLPSKNAPPPVPPKKKSIEMILAEEARAMRQHSLRGFEASVQETVNPEIKNDELKSENKTKQNIEISSIQEQTETAVDKNEKHEMMQNPDQKIHVTPLIQTKKFETQKEKIHLVPPTTEEKSQEVMSEKNKIDTVKPKTGDGQQQQSRRCVIL